MHWLPLVAMVIASALPFPHSPVPRLVSAATEPGGDLDNNRNGISDRENSSGNVIVDGSYSRSTTSTSLRTDNMDESEGLVDYSSQSNTVHNSLQEDYSSQSNTVHNSFQEDYSSQSNTVHNSLQEDYSQIGEVKEKTHVDYRTPSAINHVEHQSQDIQKHTTHSVKSDPCNNTQNISTEDRRPTQGQLGLPHLEDYSPQGNDRQVNDISLDYHTPEDYKSQELVSGENNNFVDNRYPFNTGKGKTDQLTDISVRRNYIPYWDGTENKELSPVHRAPDEPYDYPEKQMEAETEGKEAAIEGGWAGLEAGGEGGWAGLEADGGKLLKDTDLLFLDAHPRVLFTPSSSPPKHPPLLLMLEAGLMAAVGERDGRQEEQGEDEEDEGGGALMGRGDPKPRPRRASPAYDRRGERSVCEVANEWVTDKKTAIDIRGNTVTVLPEIQTPRGPLKQYFFETKCRPPDARGTGGSGLSGRDCVGVDKKHWVSECKAKQSYVRALTTHPQKGVGWRWIRIDSSCVCVLQARVPRS